MLEVSTEVTVGKELAVGLLEIVGLLDIEGSELVLGTEEGKGGVKDGTIDTLGPNNGCVKIDGFNETEGASEILGSVDTDGAREIDGAMDMDGSAEIDGAAEALGCLEGLVLGILDTEGLIVGNQLGGDDEALDGRPVTGGDSLGCGVGGYDKDGC